MRQNAEQILAIVKKTFPENSFDGRVVQHCAESQSDGDLLDCLWSKAIQSVEVKGQHMSVEALPTLVDVSLTSSTLRDST